MNSAHLSLNTPTPAEGQRLARRLAEDLLASLPSEDRTMPEMLSTGASSARPDASIVTAIYFHAICVANGGWRE